MNLSPCFSIYSLFKFSSSFSSSRSLLSALSPLIPVPNIFTPSFTSTLSLGSSTSKLVIRRVSPRPMRVKFIQIYLPLTHLLLEYAFSPLRISLKSHQLKEGSFMTKILLLLIIFLGAVTPISLWCILPWQLGQSFHSHSSQSQQCSGHHGIWRHKAQSSE